MSLHRVESVYYIAGTALGMCKRDPLGPEIAQDPISHHGDLCEETLEQLATTCLEPPKQRAQAVVVDPS